MPINATYEYGEAEKQVSEAKTPKEKIKALEHLLSVSPNHKGTERLRLEIKTKISKLKEKIEKERSKKTAGFSLSIKREGAAQIALVGLPNSGKSTILNKFTNAKVAVAEYEFTTKIPEIGVMDYDGVKIQVIEIPAIFKGFSDGEKGPTLLGIARSTDLVVIVVDGYGNCEADIKLIEEEFKNNYIILEKIKKQKTEHEVKKCLVVVNKVIKNFKSEYPVCWVDDFKTASWNMLGLVYAYTKQPGKHKDFPPVAMKKGSKVKNLASLVHKDFLEKFDYARIWGKSVKHNGTTVGLDHILKEGDIVEFHTK